MALPWLRILDAVIGVTDLARSRKMKSLSRTGGDPESLEASGQRAPLQGLEARLAGVMVAALKEVFDRDSRRLELERSQADAERERAERALRLELLRQRADREIGRLRLLAAVGVVGWLGTLSFASRMVEPSSRVMFAGGWLVLLAAVATSFAAQAQVASAVERAKGVADGTSDDRDAAWSSAPASIALWLVVLGLALVGLAILL
jgi:hypothetical protein